MWVLKHTFGNVTGLINLGCISNLFKGEIVSQVLFIHLYHKYLFSLSCGQMSFTKTDEAGRRPEVHCQRTGLY